MNLSPECEQLLDAAQENHLKSVRLFLSQGTSVNSCKEDGLTSLHIAAEMGFLDLLQLLLSVEDICIDHKATCGSTPLHCAVKRDHKEASFSVKTFKQLTSIIFQVNAVNTFEETPLHIAILRSPSKVITILLLRSGAYHDPKSGNSMGLLMELALQASSSWHIDVIKLLVRHGAQLKVVEPLGKRSLLHIVAMTGYLPLASYLLEEGVNVYARNLQRKTPLQMAKMFNNWDMMDLLTDWCSKLEKDVDSVDSKQDILQDDDSN
uniref:Uncharacterized protein n=1 Tax=Timema bartmani TaxID=61472 RepID=A0A7R9I0X2_9NEOP|nr:unnamed protein product [Timema bartmani]